MAGADIFMGVFPIGRKGQKIMDKKNTDTYEVKRIRMPISISITGINKERNRQSIDPDSLFAITVQQGTEISNGIGENLKKYNVFDYSCLHGVPDKTAFDRMLTFSLLYKSELGDLEEIAADNATASLICGRGSEEFFHYLNESGYSIVKCGNGIYHAGMFMLIDIYMIVMPELGEPEHGWMESVVRQASSGKCQEICIDCPECNFRIVEF